MNWFWEMLQKLLLRQERSDLSEEELQNILRQTAALDRSRFQRAMTSVHSLLLGVKVTWEKAAIFDLAIWAIGRSIAADGCSNLMLGKYVQENRDLAYAGFPDIPEAHGDTRLVDLAKCNAYTGCWSHDRISSSIESIFMFGYQQPPHSNGVYYPELRLAIMYNGRHHTSWATFLEDCTVELETVHLTPYFDIVDTDGAFYDFRNLYNEPQHIRVPDYRMAVLFQLAKERSSLDLPHAADAYARPNG